MSDAKIGEGSLSGALRLHLAQSEILDYQYSRALSDQLYGGASTGEVVRVAGLMKERGGTRVDWVTVWTEQGRLSHSLGEEALAQGHLETARY